MKTQNELKNINNKIPFFLNPKTYRLYEHCLPVFRLLTIIFHIYFYLNTGCM